MTMLIREVVESDLDALAALQVEVHDAHVAAHPSIFQPIRPDEMTRSFVRDQLQRESGQTFVAVDDGVVGFVAVRLHESPVSHLYTPRRYAEIETLVVRHDARRLGVGRSLVTAARSWALTKGVVQCQLSVFEFNAEAIRFYESLGFLTLRRTMRIPEAQDGSPALHPSTQLPSDE